MSDAYTTTQDFGDDQRTARPLPLPFLFVVLHTDEPRRGGARFALYGTTSVTIGRGVIREAVRTTPGELHIRLPSGAVSKEHARLVRRDDEWIFQDLDSRNGSSINGRRVSNAVLRDGDWIEVGGILLRLRMNLFAPTECSADLDLTCNENGVRGYASLLPNVEASFRSLARVAHSPVTTLLSGETGTGKEVLARGMHVLSGRTGPFVAVNCGALTSSLLESHLFGHVKGSFTGASSDEPGLIRSADGGTLFLDEVGDLPLPAQAALLRVLQEREVLPIGGIRPTKVDVRIIASTNKPLEMLCIQGEFRSDLLSRIAGYQHVLSPLRDRLEDLGLVVGDLLRNAPADRAKTLRIHIAAARKLVYHPWPQNIRELDNVLSVAVALADNGVLELSHLPENMTKSTGKTLPDSDPPSDPDALRGQIVQLLEQHHGNVTLVARAMGKSRMQLHRWMQKFGIDPEAYRSSS